MSEKVYENNCSKCGEQLDSFTRIKGSNNTELCYKCGNNICFICDKKWEKEKNFRWVEDYDCCGNKIMAKAYWDIFSQYEKDENHPEGNLTVYYCDKHRHIGEKSPNKWTKEDREQLEKQKKQREWEIAEKLNSQKVLFYCQDDYAHAYEGKHLIKGIKYGCFEFWGRENGKSFYLLVPDTHPVLNNFKYQKKEKRNGIEKEFTCYNLKEQFYLIEGIEKLPLEVTHDSGYSGNDPLIQAQHFSKVVGLNDKITIVSVDSQGNPEKNKPVENKPTDNYSKSAEEFKEFLLQYFQQKNIKSIKLEGDKVNIEYNNSTTESKEINSNELQQTKSYLQKIGKQELSLSDLEQSSNQTNNSNGNSYWLWILGIGGILVVILISWLVIRNKKKNK